MEYLQKNQIRSLLAVAMEHNQTHHLALLLMYATSTRVSQMLKLTGNDVYTDDAGVTKVRIPKAKRGLARSYEIFKSNNPVLDLSPIIEIAKQRGSSRLFGGLSRQYMHTVIKRYGALARIPVDLIHCHILRHSTAMRIWNESKSLGAITGYLCHSSPESAYPYLREHDASIAERIMREELEAI